MKSLISFCISFAAILLAACTPSEQQAQKPRVLISTDIGGTDPDDNQSMIHLLMYSDCFELEGLVSSPFAGTGSKEEILRMIDFYEKDYPKLREHREELMTPDELRAICKEGRRGLAKYCGYDKPTEGSEWIVECARKESDRPLWILVWGGLEDIAQALHDAPEILPNIRVYWIGGPNKKWGVNAYSYIVENFPDLWMIENNASYRGFIGDKKKNSELEYIEIFQSKKNEADSDGLTYYDCVMKNAGHMGNDFKAYYDGNIKMGDTPSLLYMMHGNPEDPMGESWGGSFEPLTASPRTIFTRNSTLQDTVAVYSVIEYRLEGPSSDMSVGTPCFTFHIDKQDWQGEYLGNGTYAVRYSPKAPATLDYTISSDIKELDGMKGAIVVSGLWPGNVTKEAYNLGKNWYTDRQAPELFDGKWQGCKTVSKWRNEVLDDWAQRWSWLKE